MTYSAQLRVLIVDDDFRVVRVHRNFVERVPGFTVVGESATGEEALTAIRELNPDLVLLDIYLPDKSGLEVLSALRQSQHPVHVLVVSAARDLETVRQAYHGGVVQYLVKPFSSADLEKRLLDYQRRRRTSTRPRPHTTGRSPRTTSTTCSSDAMNRPESAGCPRD